MAHGWKTAPMTRIVVTGPERIDELRLAVR
jgi:hypothetical protein